MTNPWVNQYPSPRLSLALKSKGLRRQAQPWRERLNLDDGRALRHTHPVSVSLALVFIRTRFFDAESREGVAAGGNVACADDE